MWIFVDESGRIPAGRVAYGDLGPDVGNGAAVAVYCDRGGASWPEAVVLYGPGPTYLGHVVLSDLTPGRQSVVSLAVADGVVRVGFVNSWAADEVGRRGRVDGTVALTLVGGEVRAGDLRLVDERPTADQAVAAAVAGDTAELGEVALADAATALVDLVARLQAGGFRRRSWRWGRARRHSRALPSRLAPRVWWSSGPRPIPRPSGSSPTCI